MRHVQSFLLFFNVTSIYCSRLNIGVAVVAMTNSATANPDFPVSKKKNHLNIIIKIIKNFYSHRNSNGARRKSPILYRVSFGAMYAHNSPAAIFVRNSEQSW